MVKRADDKKYEGRWRMEGRKVEDDDDYWQAALRELDEETSLPVIKMWTVPSLNHFYEAKTDSILLIPAFAAEIPHDAEPKDRKSTRLNSSHVAISYAVFCLKKKSK